MAIVGLAAAVLAACSSTPVRPPAPAKQGAATGEDATAPPPARPEASGRRGAYYLDDGPGERDPLELAALAGQPDPTPFPEPLHPRANQPYRVLGNDYRPMTRREPFRQRGVASWYGRKFHGQLTSIGERYDMYGLTAAHPTLPIPSFVRVTHLGNRRSVVLRVNDRGPFLHGRAIDLSYLAAYKLGYAEFGSAEVEVELLDPTRPMDAQAATPEAARQPVIGPEVSSTVAAGPSTAGPGSGTTPMSVPPAAAQRVPVPAGAVSTATLTAAPMAPAQTAPARTAAVPTIVASPAVTSSTGFPTSSNSAVTSGATTSPSAAIVPDPSEPATAAPIIISRVTSTPTNSALAGSAPSTFTPTVTSPASSPPAKSTSTATPPTAVSATTSSPTASSPTAISATAISPTASSPPGPSASATPSAAPPVDGAHFLQLGAFSLRTNAESASTELRRQLDWLRVPIAVEPRGGLFLVQAGPYPVRDLAARAGIEVKARTGLRPLLLPR